MIIEGNKYHVISCSKDEILNLEYNGRLYLNTTGEDVGLWKEHLLKDKTVFLCYAQNRMVVTELVDKQLDFSTPPTYIVRKPLILKFRIIGNHTEVVISSLALLNRHSCVSKSEFEKLTKSATNIPALKLNLHEEVDNAYIYKSGGYSVRLAKSDSDYREISKMSKYHSFGLRTALMAFICVYEETEIIGAMLFDIANDSRRTSELSHKLFGQRAREIRDNSIFIHRLYSFPSAPKKIILHETLVNSIIFSSRYILNAGPKLIEGISYDFLPVTELIKFNVEIPSKIDNSFYYWKLFDSNYNNIKDNNISKFGKSKIHEILALRSKYKYWVVIGTESNIERGLDEGAWIMAKNHHNTGRWHQIKSGDIVFFYATNSHSFLGYGHVRFTERKKLRSFPNLELFISFNSIVKSQGHFYVNKNAFEKIYDPYKGGVFPITSKIGLFIIDNIDKTNKLGKMWVNPNPYLLHETRFKIEPKQVFLVQAYSMFKGIYPTICETLKKNNYDVKHFTDRNGQVVFDDIWVLLNESAAVIVDFTDKRPNVYLEFGMALVLGKPIVAISQSMEDIPTDTPNLKVIIYKDSKSDKALENRLVAALEQAIDDINKRKDDEISFFSNG